jgi:NAD(P)-dependent dehydrogenase (short-subunit alcohol dehydrogenase family)
MTGTCLILGVTSDLGRHCAHAWREAGWRVIGTHRAEADGDRIPEGIETLVLNLASSEDLARCLELLPSCPELTISCAATYPEPETDALSLAELQNVFSVNALSAYALMRALLQRREPSQRAAFVLLGTTAMFNADLGSGVYAASKAALRVLCAALADECRGTQAAAMYLVLGHLANERKLNEIAGIAERHGVPVEEVRRRFLRKAEPGAMVDDFIGFDLCVNAIRYLSEIGPMGNGTVLRLDGGASGTLV